MSLKAIISCVFISIIAILLCFYYKQQHERRKWGEFINEVHIPLRDKLFAELQNGDINAVNTLVEILKSEEKYGYCRSTLVILKTIPGLIISKDPEYSKLIDSTKIIFEKEENTKKRRIETANMFILWLKEQQEKGNLHIEKSKIIHIQHE